jgi:ATP-dependent helicase HrpA
VTDPVRISAAAKRPLAGAGGAGQELGAGVEGVGAHYTRELFTAAVERAKADLRGLVPRFVDQLREILTLRQDVLVVPEPPAGLTADLAALLPADFLRVTPYAQLAHFPRYLKAMRLRAERARKNPAKDAERAKQIAAYAAAAAKFRAREGGEAFRWLVEEFRVSLFAQELGTAEPVSPVKLDRALATLQSVNPVQRGVTASSGPPPSARPIVAAPVTDKKPERIKNLNALDKLFGR